MVVFFGPDGRYKSIENHLADSAAAGCRRKKSSIVNGVISAGEEMHPKMLRFPAGKPARAQRSTGAGRVCTALVILTIGGCVGLSLASREPEKKPEELQMDDDFVDVFPSAGGVGDSPVRTAEPEHLGAGSPWPRPPISLSIPGLDTGGRAAAVSPAIPGSRGVATPSPAKEGVLRSARTVSGARDEDVVESPAPSPHPIRAGVVPLLTIDPGGECVPTELEKKRAKLEKFRYECSEVRAAG